jgi:hypothetical protein
MTNRLGIEDLHKGEIAQDTILIETTPDLLNLTNLGEIWRGPLLADIYLVPPGIEEPPLPYT